MKSNYGKEVLRKYFDETVEKFEQYYNNPEQYHKIFADSDLLI